MTVRFAYALIRTHCLHCKGWMLPWQGRCGNYHTVCKHYLDGEHANRNGMARWRCNWCGR